MECVSPPGTVKVSFHFLCLLKSSVRKHGIIDYTPMRAIFIIHVQKPDSPKCSFPKMGPRLRIHVKCQTPPGKPAFAIANLPAFPSLTAQNIQCVIMKPIKTQTGSHILPLTSKEN